MMPATPFTLSYRTCVREDFAYRKASLRSEKLRPGVYCLESSYSRSFACQK